MRGLLLVSLLLVSNEAVGGGVFAHVHLARNRDRWQGWDPQELVALPGLAGTQASFAWNELETAQGVYDWSRVHEILDLWGDAGKTVWIEISTADHGNTGPSRLPSYVFSSVPFVTSPENGAIFPVFWDATYKSHWRNFLEAFAEEFDGDSRIEFLSMGGAGSRHEAMRLASDENDATLDQWEAYGFDGFEPNGVYFQQGHKAIMDIYQETFQQTKLGLNITFGEPSSGAMLQLVEDYDWVAGTNGWSYRHADEQSRQAHRRRADEYGDRFGVFEWGPAGRGDPPLTIGQMYAGALGYSAPGQTDPELRYLPWGFRDELETKSELVLALLLADQHLNNEENVVEPGDVNENGSVDGFDFLAMQRNVGSENDLAGDLENDGNVNSEDFDYWSQQYGASLSGTDFLAWQRDVSRPELFNSDVDRDRDVDSVDLSLWGAQYSAADFESSAQVSTVPEATTSFLLLCGLVSMVPFRGRNHS